MAGTYAPILIGALIGAAVSFVYIKRTKALSNNDSSRDAYPRASRQQAIKSVLVIYVLISWVCFAVAVSFGDSGFILTTGAIAAIATVGSAIQWRRGN